MMSNPTHQQMIIEESHINLFYFFEQAPDPQANYWKELAQVLPEALQPEEQPEALANTPFWEQDAPTLTGDLLPNITGLFQPGKQQAVETWKLTSQILAHINGSRRFRGKDKPSLVPVIHLTPAACQRLETDNCEVAAPRLLIESVHYYRFRTGMGVAMVDLRLTNHRLTGGLLQEAIHALTRFNTLGWLEPDSPPPKLTKKERVKAPTMGAVVRALLGCESEKHRRAYSHVYARLKEKSAKLDDYLVHLARHYTSDYRFSGEMGETMLMRDFENVQHCIANEGMATLVLADDQATEFIMDYYNKVTRQAHLPICLLNYHAEYAIQHFMSKAGVWLEAGKAPKLDLSEMLEQQRNLVNFDSHFFLPVVSKINTHNRLHRAMQKIKYLDQQHQIVSRMTRLISSLIIAEKEKMEAKITDKRAKTYCRFGSVGVAAAGYLTVSSIAKELLEVAEKEWLEKGSSMYLFLEHHSGSVGLITALVSLVLILYFSFRKCGLDQHQDHKHGIAMELAENLHLYHLRHTKD